MTWTLQVRWARSLWAAPWELTAKSLQSTEENEAKKRGGDMTLKIICASFDWLEPLRHLFVFALTATCARTPVAPTPLTHATASVFILVKPDRLPTQNPSISNWKSPLSSRHRPNNEGVNTWLIACRGLFFTRRFSAAAQRGVRQKERRERQVEPGRRRYREQNFICLNPKALPLRPDFSSFPSLPPFIFFSIVLILLFNTYLCLAEWTAQFKRITTQSWGQAADGTGWRGGWGLFWTLRTLCKAAKSTV